MIAMALLTTGVILGYRAGAERIYNEWEYQWTNCDSRMVFTYRGIGNHSLIFECLEKKVPGPILEPYDPEKNSSLREG